LRAATAAILAVLLVSAVPGLSFSKGNIRQSAVSGQFYPSSTDILKRKVARYLDDALSKPDPGVRAIVAPHAGYSFSGRIAGEAFNLVRHQKFESVIIIGFSHQTPLRGVFVDDVAEYKTPLGNVPVDQELAQAIREHHPILQDKVQGHFPEHSVEVEVPFLQVALPQLRIVPIYMGIQSPEHAKILAGAIAKAIGGKNVLTVVSSDCSHFHPYEVAKRKDAELAELYESADIPALIKAHDEKTIEACGMGPMLTLLYLREMMGWTKPKLVRYENSGDVTGDWSRVVGYAAFSMSISAEFNETEQKALLKYARGILEAYYTKGGKEPELELDSPILDENRGVFVTLKRQGHLRGCIGRIVAREPLRQNLKTMALSAALHDRRFRPVKAEELEDIEIHISILSDPRPARSYKEIRLGTDGIIVSKGFKSGVYLPEVATDTGWDQETFFTHCAINKAGMKPKELKDAQLRIFQTQSFGETGH